MMTHLPARRQLARWVTEALAPAPLTILAVLVVAWEAAPTPGQALRWGLVGALFAPLLPFLHLVRQVRRGHVTDYHVMRREQRPRILLLALASGLAGAALLAGLGAPPALVALMLAGVSGIGVALLITLRWKISVHVGALAGIIVVCAILIGPQALIVAPLVPLVAWARVELGAHTPAQAIAGGVIGALVSGTAYLLARAMLG